MRAAESLRLAEAGSTYHSEVIGQGSLSSARRSARRYDWSQFASRIDDIVQEVAKSHAGSGAATSSLDQN